MFNKYTIYLRVFIYLISQHDERHIDSDNDLPDQKDQILPNASARFPKYEMVACLFSPFNTLQTSVRCSYQWLDVCLHLLLSTLIRILKG